MDLAFAVHQHRRRLVTATTDYRSVALPRQPSAAVVIARRLPFRGRRGNLLKLVWHDGIGLCMLTKRLERGHFIWPMTSTGSIALSAGQLSTLLEGCEWRATARNLRPELAG